MLKRIDHFLDRITMYRLMLYFLILLLTVGLVLSFLGMTAFTPFALLASISLIMLVSLLADYLFAWIFRTHNNVESVYITSLILALIITPPQTGGLVPYVILAGWASLWAIASKYLFAIGKKHVFNPAALGVAMVALTLGLSASWWVGTGLMMPFVLIGGSLIVRKIRRADLVWAFLIGAAISILGMGLLRSGFDLSALGSLGQKTLLDAPVLFFAFVMLTEPLTTPPTSKLRIFYGALVGLIFAPSIHIGNVYTTPELALLVGNIFSYFVSPKQKLILRLKRKVRLTPDVYEFVFKPDKQMAFQPGQYIECTLGHEKPDNRGNRRYFTLASSPTERSIRLGIKFYPQASSFKNRMMHFKAGDEIIAGQLAGDFVMPKDQSKKLVFVAGGIGITPFRSMIKYLLDKGEKRDIILLYACNRQEDFAYREIFDQAAREIGIKNIYYVGIIDKNTVMEKVPDYNERTFYVSGPQIMVTTFQNILGEAGVHNDHIKKDFFPGFA